MEKRSRSEGNASFSNSGQTSCTECSTESDEVAKFETETAEFKSRNFHALFTNTARVYMYSKRIFEDVSFHDCKPQMK
ncbi:hypothetical protein MKW94_019391, partial [Papaver nudicaule]|nr:hypothetical protein [Papaver nudicaule]